MQSGNDGFSEFFWNRAELWADAWLQVVVLIMAIGMLGLLCWLGMNFSERWSNRRRRNAPPIPVILPSRPKAEREPRKKS